MFFYIFLAIYFSRKPMEQMVGDIIMQVEKEIITKIRSKSVRKVLVKILTCHFPSTVIFVKNIIC